MSEVKQVREKIYGRPETKNVFPMGNCPGCHYGLIIRAICEAIDELGIQGKCIGVNGVGCSFSLGIGMDIDGINCAHGAAPAVACGLKQANFGKPIVFTLQGDGDCAAIGMGYLINAANRADRITVFLVNNGNFGTTGGQMAPTSLHGQVTTTTPGGRDSQVHGYPAHVPEMLAQIKGVAYAARASLDTPANFQRAKKMIKTALQKQIDGVGFSFVELLSACPPDWHLKPVEALHWIRERMMAEFPLGEIKNIEKIPEDSV